MKNILLIIFFIPYIVFSQANTTGFKNSIVVGTSTNNVTLGGASEFYLNGSYSQWDDVVVPATTTRVNPTSFLPAFSLDSVALLFVRDADSSEKAYYQIQIPHSTRYGTNVACNPHFHYYQYGAADTTYQMVLMYRVGEVAGVVGSWKRMTTVSRALFTYTSSPFHQIGEFGDILLNNINESSYIDFKMYRIDAAGNPATLYVKGFDVHFEFVSLGTINEYPSH